MRFSVVTPSLHQLESLECCIASVADQEDVEVEHIVQDGGTKGFTEFAQKMARQWPDRPNYRRIMVSEKDAGMYDAINRGFAKASGMVFAYLNCDEQYLVGVLAKIETAFCSQPATDLFFGDTIILRENGEPVCWRKFLVPGIAHTWTCHFSALSAAMFFRRRLWEGGLRFDANYRTAADAAWYLTARRRGAKAEALGFFTSTFMETGKNLGMTAVARQERKRLTQTAPPWIRFFRLGWLLLHKARRISAGAHRAKTVTYKIHTPRCTERKEHHAMRLRATWPGRIWGY